jgi:predicted Zn finger-like uncharacterized protein
MFIQCPACSTRYEMPDGSLKAEGRKVRCASCKEVWNAKPDVVIEQPQLKAAISEPVEAANARINLKVERTTDDDWAAPNEDELDNSQDDIDALFDTPSAEEFGGGIVDEPPLVSVPVKPPTRMAALKNWMSARRSKKVSKPVTPKTVSGSKIASSKTKTNKFPKAASIAAVLFLGLGASLVYRENVVSALPQSAKLYQLVGLPVNLRGVVIQNVTSRISLEQGNPELTVEGEITNVTRHTAKLSRLRFAIRSDNGREIYSWKASADKPVLEPGESMKFRRKLSGPPEEGHDVLVRFEAKGDMVAGVQ